MSDLKTMMAMKYPTKKDDLAERHREDLERYSDRSENCMYKRLYTSIFLGIVFLLLSLPQTYHVVSKTLKIESTCGNQCLSIKSSIVHAIVFSIVCFVYLSFSQK